MSSLLQESEILLLKKEAENLIQETPQLARETLSLHIDSELLFNDEKEAFEKALLEKLHTIFSPFIWPLSELLLSESSKKRGKDLATIASLWREYTRLACFQESIREQVFKAIPPLYTPYPQKNPFYC